MFPNLLLLPLVAGFVARSSALPAPVPSTHGAAGGATAGSASRGGPHVSQTLQNILDNTHGSTLYRYPTDLTRGIIPKDIHSHNDYWRDVPFYSALAVGATSIEVDVWLYNDTLYVGHDQLALTEERTLESLYLNPILDTLNRQNPESTFPALSIKHGVFDTRVTQTLYLFVDIKTDGPSTWPAVVRALEPLRQAGYLTRFSSPNNVSQGAITVIGTGSTPLAQIQGQAQRDVFFDAPLAALNSTAANITASVSPIASASFSRNFGTVRVASLSGSDAEGEGQGPLNATQLATLRSHIKTAHDKGIKARYWDLPGWPISTRNALWRQLYDEGVDLLNVDDLASAAGLTDAAGNW